MVLLSSRGDYGYEDRLLPSNHVEAGVVTALRYIGIELFERVAVEYDEFGDTRLLASIAAAEMGVDALAAQLAAKMEPQRACACA